MSTVFEQYTAILAGEGIPLDYSADAPTAYFDIENRDITIPTFEYLDADTTQLLVSHEIGHARFTDCSLDDFQALVKKFGDIFNIVEDVFIERQMKSMFPGLKPIFKHGYRSLFDNNFFGDFDIEKLHFVDKLNLLAKIGHCLPEIKFASTYEYDLASRFMAVDSRVQVLELCEEILKYIGEDNKPESKKNGSGSSDKTKKSSSNKKSNKTKNNSKKSSSSSNEDSESDANEQQSDDFEDKNENDEDINSNASGDNSSDEQDESDDGERSGNENNGTESAPFKSQTATAFSDALKSFGKKEANKQIANGGVFILNSSDNKIENIMYVHNDTMNKIGINYINSQGAEFNKNARMVKLAAGSADAIFQRKISAKAKRLERNKKTGSIDSRKLVNYKTKDNIFKTLKVQDKQINHGVVILVDFSGSMSGIIKEVLVQAAIAAEFCKKNNIPFVVIAYGTNIRNSKKDYSCMKLADSLSYKLENVLGFYYSASSYGIGMGCTPMDAGVFCAYEFLKSYKINGVDKNVLFVITDGDYHKQLNIRVTSKNSYGKTVIQESFSGSSIASNAICNELIFDGVKTSIAECGHKVMSMYSNYEGYIDCLFRHIKKTLDTTIIFSYLLDNSISISEFLNIYKTQKQSGNVYNRDLIGQILIANDLSLTAPNSNSVVRWNCNEKYLDTALVISYREANNSSAGAKWGIMDDIANTAVYKKLLCTFV